MQAARIETRVSPDILMLMDSAQRASEVTKAVSHEARLPVLCVLSEAEASAADLVQQLCLPQAAVSQRLARLRSDGRIKARRDGRLIPCDIATPEATAAIETLHRLYHHPGAAG